MCMSFMFFFLVFFNAVIVTFSFNDIYISLHAASHPAHTQKTCLAHSSLFNSVFSGDFYRCPAKFLTALLLRKCHHTWIRKIYLGGLFEGEEPWISGSVLFVLCLWGHLEPGLLLETPKTNSLLNLWNYLFIENI